MVPSARQTGKFFVEIIKPSHYDDDGYVIQWFRAFIPSNSLACLYGLAKDVKDRQVLGDDVEIVINAYDELHTVIPVRNIIKRMQNGGGHGIVLLAGVQSNQFPRAVDLAREFRRANIPVAIGGFHVSGCIAMLSSMPDEIKAAQEMGIALFAGEAEGRMEQLLGDAYRGELKPIYNFMLDLPDLRGQITPVLPKVVSRRYMHFTPFDVGRGCPFQCSFCTIINVQGRKSRYRNADDVEQVVRTYVEQGIRRFFITDDNMARNRNWESIFDRLIQLREEEGLRIKFVIQVDTMCHKIPNFIEKATRAGCNRVFIGLENINPDTLVAAKKFQNRITEYRRMMQAWRSRGVVTYAGYILGFPNDTPESIERDIKVIQRELPIDIVEFFILTPLPGSADHKELYEKGVWMDPDMNKYDVEHVTIEHAKMSTRQWQDIYDQAWHLYYSPQHVKTLLLRAEASGAGAKRMALAILQYYGSFVFEKVHPLQCGIGRRKVRRTRRPGLPKQNPLLFYPRRFWESVKTYTSLGAFFLRLERVRRQVQRELQGTTYTDLALTPVEEQRDEELQIYSITDAAKNAVAKSKAKRQPRSTQPCEELAPLRRAA